MRINGYKKMNLATTALVLLSLSFIFGCGAAAPPEDGAEQAAPEQPAVQQEVATPTAVPQAVSSPPEVTEPAGTLNVGLKEMGPFFVHPKVMKNPQIFVQSTAPIGEGLLMEVLRDGERTTVGLLAESWSISDDFLTWTFNLHKGVQFHKGYGEMTAEDVVYSMQQYKHSKHPRAGQLEKFWQDRPGSSIIDSHTVAVNTGEPVVDLIAESWHGTPGGASTFIVSKEQSMEIGVEAAQEDIATTGPWEIREHRTNEFWRMEAVEDHWRQTPDFAELVFWEIPEESSRLAGFQTGELDTFLMAFDSIPLVEEVEGARLLSVPDAILMRNRVYGNWYPIPGVEARPGYDPELPWVSPNPDPNSPEWARARNVRKALFMAIDRDALVETILGGRGHTRTPLSGYTKFVHYLEGRDWPAFDPEGAKALLAEAGYPDGFSITLTPSIRGAPAEVESCEVIAQMWNDIGLDVDFQRVPYTTLRPTLVGRTYQGVTCHAGSPIGTPARGYGSYLSDNPFNRGVEHPWLEERMIKAQAAVDPVEREQLEREIGQFILDNYLTDMVYYTMDAVWPVGPRLDDKAWKANVKTFDVRQINGYEYIQHRR